MVRFLGIVVLLASSLGACGDDDDDRGPTCQAPPEDACDEPIRCCPPERPYEGGLCEEGLVCEYPDPESEDPEARIVDRCASDGRWSTVVQCAAGCTVDLAETCLDPFEGTLEGATVELGPASRREAFQPFDGAGAEAPIVQGPQGCAMVAARLRVSGASAPDCAIVRTTVTVDSGDPVIEDLRVKLRCGESLGVLTVLPDPYEWCETLGPHRIVMLVEILGIGETSADLTFEVREDDDYCACFADEV